MPSAKHSLARASDCKSLTSLFLVGMRRRQHLSGFNTDPARAQQLSKHPCMVMTSASLDLKCRQREPLIDSSKPSIAYRRRTGLLFTAPAEKHAQTPTRVRSKDHGSLSNDQRAEDNEQGRMTKNQNQQRRTIKNQQERRTKKENQNQEPRKRNSKKKKTAVFSAARTACGKSSIRILDIVHGGAALCAHPDRCSPCSPAPPHSRWSSYSAPAPQVVVSITTLLTLETSNGVARKRAVSVCIR